MADKPKALRSTWLGSGSGVRLDFRVDNLDTIMETWESVKLFAADTEEGSYSEVGTPATLVADTHEYSVTHSAGTEAKWYKVGFYESAGPTDGEKTDPVVGSGGGRYITVQDMRDYGWGATDATNAELRRAILEAERWVEMVTGNVFYPRQRTYPLDGVESSPLILETPIIQIDEIQILGTLGDVFEELTELQLSSSRIYNRHLTFGLTNPDDRDVPKIELLFGAWGTEPLSVRLTGWFGYTELAADEVPAETVSGSQKPVSRGGPPYLLRRALMLLMPRFLASPADADAYEDATRGKYVQRYEARDQKIHYAVGSVAVGGLTGDPDVDAFLEHFLQPQATGELI